MDSIIADKYSEVKYTLGASYNKEITREKGTSERRDN